MAYIGKLLTNGPLQTYLLVLLLTITIANWHVLAQQQQPPQVYTTPPVPLQPLPPLSLPLEPQLVPAQYPSQPSRSPQPIQPRPPPQGANYSPCPRAIKINTNYHFRGALHFICLQPTRSRILLEVINYQTRQLVSWVEVDEYGANQLASFVDDEGTLRILLAAPNRINGTSMYSIDKQGRFIKEKHSVNTQLVNAITIWRLELNWEWQLATVNQPSYEALIRVPLHTRSPIPDLKPMVTIHSWRPNYFDRYQLMDLPQDGKVNKLEPMNINGQEFLIVALESSRSDHKRGLAQADFPSHSSHHAAVAVESLIYKLDFGDGNLNWLHFQYLNTRLALDVKSFVVAHQGSLHKDYYIVILGQASPIQTHYNQPGYLRRNYTNAGPANNDDGQYGLLIYKYFGDQFMRTHSIPMLGATKLDAISYGQGDSYVIIAILSKWSHKISLFLFDGLELKPMPGPTVGVPLLAQPRLVGAKSSLDNSSNFHLFLAPPALQESTETTNDTSVKRTLSEEMPQTLTVPALALTKSSDLDEGDDDDENEDAKGPDFGSNKSNSTASREKPEAPDSIYHIPITDMIRQSQLEQQELLKQQQQLQLNDSDKEDDSGPTKRNYIGRVQQNAGQELLAWCKSTINSILADNFDMDAKRLLALPRVDQRRPIEFNGDLIIEDDLHVTNLLFVKNIVEQREPEPNPIVIENIRSNYSDTFNQIQRTHMEIDDVKRRVDQILVDDGSDQDVFNPLTFETMVLECPGPLSADPRLQHSPYISSTCPHVNELRTIFLNSHDISNIQRQALLTGRSMNITRNVRFEHLVLRGSVDILDTLNGIRINEIVFKRGPSTGPIFGHKNFLNGLFSSSNLVVENWNGVHVDRQNFLTSTGNQRIEAELRFSHIVIDPASSEFHRERNFSLRIEKLNNKNLDTHLSQIALANDDNNFEVPVHFEELVLNGPVRFTANSRLSTIDIESLWLSTMFRHSNQNVTAPIEFSDVHVSFGGDILVEGTVNGIPSLNSSSILMRNRDYSLPNPILFDHDVSVNDLRLARALNGIGVDLNPFTGVRELSIMYDGGNQFVSSDKLLNEVHLGGRSWISGNINGHLNLTQLYNLVNNNGEPYRFSTVHLTGQNIRVADGVPLHIDSTINGVHVNNICSLANQVAQSAHVRYNRLKFEQPIYFKSLRCATINGFNNLSNSFMTRHGDQYITGTLNLANGVIFNTTVQVTSTLNDFDVRPLSSAIARTVNESRTGHKVMYGDLVVDELIAERINNLSLSSVFLARADRPQLVQARMTFDHLDIENVLNVGQNLVTNSFNGLNITDIISNTLQYDTPQIIYNHVEVNTLQLLTGSNFMTKSVNGHNLQRLYADAVLVDVPQQILAPKTFRAPVKFTNRLMLRHGIDGLSNEELRLNLLLHSDELIDGDLEFNEDVTIEKELEIQSGVINDIDLNLFVDSMLYENRPDRKGLRIVGNGSIRFKDVKVSNLVVAGTIQGLDLSKEALLRGEHINSTTNSTLKEIQAQNNNKRILNLYGPGSSFKVASNYRGEEYWGTCFVNPSSQFVNMMFNHSPPQFVNTVPNRPPPQFVHMTPDHSLTRPVNVMPTYSLNKIVDVMPKPFVNNSIPTWRPILFPSPQTLPPMVAPQKDPNELAFFEYKTMLEARAIQDLASKINRFLSISFYYEIAQKHPLLGPLLNTASNPIPSEQGGALLLLKATSKFGEPCLRRGQTIAIMAQQRARKSAVAFTQSSRIQETSNPSIVESVVVGQSYYLFILDSQPSIEGAVMSSQVLIYLWDYKSGMYELKERIVIDGFPTAMKAFKFNNNAACFALANPRVTQGNFSVGSPILYCQQAPLSPFNQRILIRLANVFDLDIMSATHNSSRIIIAALSQQDTEQIGDLSISSYDLNLRSLQIISLRRTVRPMKLHLFPNFGHIQLAVSEAITSSDDAQAITRIFSLRTRPAIGREQYTFYESQVFKDNQFYDIQSVFLDAKHSLLFFQSAHSISVYAPLPSPSESHTCDVRYALVQRLPAKGANKFLVFNDNLSTFNSSRPFGHFLVLSKDNCEQQQYTTFIMRAKFQ